MVREDRKDFRIRTSWGSLAGVFLARELNPVRNIVLCWDNHGAGGAIIRGSCKTRLGRQLSSVLCSILARVRTPIWAEWVASDFNPSGPPSRICKLAPEPVVLKGRILGPEKSFAEIPSASTELAEAEFKYSHESEGFGPPAPWVCPPCVEAESQ